MATMTATRRQTMLPLAGQPQAGPASWPLHAALELGALPTAPGCGRAWTRQIAWEWGLALLADSAALIASELLTNAILASRQLDRAAVWLALASDRAGLVIFVRDFAPGTPAPRHASEDDESGRGLTLVEGVSDRFGWEQPADGMPGKVAWALIKALLQQMGHPGVPGKPPDLSYARGSGLRHR
jgi:anti-sigma regulatory factor (Ser/Thr protein kinase)